MAEKNFHQIYPAATYVPGGTLAVIQLTCYTDSGKVLPNIITPVLLRYTEGPFAITEIDHLEEGDVFGTNVIYATKIKSACDSLADPVYILEYITDVLPFVTCCGAENFFRISINASVVNSGHPINIQLAFDNPAKNKYDDGLVVLNDQNSINKTYITATGARVISVLMKASTIVSIISPNNQTDAYPIVDFVNLEKQLSITELYLGGLTPAAFATVLSAMIDMEKLNRVTLFNCDNTGHTGIGIPSHVTNFTYISAVSSGFGTALTAISFYNIATIQNLIFINSGLTFFPRLNLATALLHVTINLNPLPAIVVNQILEDLDAAGLHNGSVSLLCDPSAAPTGAGITAASSLVSKGWAVTTN